MFLSQTDRGILVLIIFIFSGCFGKDKPQNGSSDSKNPLPERADSLENVTTFSLDNQSPDSVELVREAVFKSNEEVLIEGYISRAAVDSQNNVYILAQRPKLIKMYVFRSTGEFVNEYDLHGKGPGEFMAISSLDIINDQMVMYGTLKLAFYSLPDFTLIKDELLKRNKLGKDKPLLANKRPDNLFVRDQDMILSFNSSNGLSEQGQTSFFEVSNEGNILPGQLLELQRYPRYLTEEHTLSSGYQLRSPFTMPFTRQTVVAVSKDGPIYTAWTEDFLIKVYDHEWNYIRSFYYPFKNSPLDLSKLDLQETSEKALEHYEVPENWPVIHTMLLDDRDRLWVATITDSATHYKWWVLDRNGVLLARFEFPGQRDSRIVENKPLIKIQDGYFYREEKDEETGIGRIVKYKINFKERQGNHFAKRLKSN